MSDNEFKQIDFVEIFTKAKTFFKTYFITLIISTVLFTLVSVLYFYSAKNYYKTSFVVTDGGIDRSLFRKNILFNPLEKEYLESGSMELTEEELNTLRSDIQALKLFTVDTVVKNCLIFNVLTYDNNADFESLKRSLLYSIERNTYLKNRGELEKENIRELISELDKDFTQLDSLHFNSPENGDLSIQKIKLRKAQQNLQSRLNSIGNFEIIQDIHAPNEGVRKLSFSILFGALLGLFLGIIFGVIKDLNRLSKVKT